jgi:hypothetical protein
MLDAAGHLHLLDRLERGKKYCPLRIFITGPSNLLSKRMLYSSKTRHTH